MRLGPLAVNGDTVRVVLGLAVTLVAVDLIASRRVPWALVGQLQRAFWPFELLALGLGVVVVPRLFQVGGQFAAERRGRIRADERADLAAHLHDSVLQTLILIQRHGGDPAGMAQLARRQERELRDWLYGAVASRDAGRLRDRLTALAAEIEDRYQWRIELIVVGDGDVGAGEEALLAATREAIVNAARHSRAPLCDVYAECDPGAIRIWVRDRGVGFDYGAVARDRRGLTESVVARMERAGGGATVRSSSGGGTEMLTSPAAERLVVSAPAVTVVVVDDHELFRSGVVAELGNRVRVVAEAGDIAEAIAAIAATTPDVVLLDVHLPSGSGREVIERSGNPGSHTRFLRTSRSRTPPRTWWTSCGPARAGMSRSPSAPTTS